MIAELIWTLPFIALLGSIATLPLFQKHWWEKNYPYVSAILGLIIVARYLIGLHDAETLLHAAHEYLSFIALIGALFVVSGGIHISVKGESTPLANCIFLFVGAVLANFLGTTGASMVLIRPWLRMNKYRLTGFHVVFFIFLVSNVGGGLTPIGDPPLFLGYLKGVPFLWVVQTVWPMWLLAVSILLGVFYLYDTRNFLKAPKQIRQKETGREEEWKFEGGHNVFFLFLIIASVFIHEPIFLREIVMIAAAVVSYWTTPKKIHEKNDFNFAPIQEVSILFAGIFLTMIPALSWLETNAKSIGIQTPGQFYWGSGILSSVLDNAPTYLNFFSAAIGLFVNQGLSPEAQTADLIANRAIYLEAISVASVFFGAMTYIGNGPNFLVKSIADQSKAHTPSFFGYILRYSLPILLPTLTLVWFLFYRGH